MLKLKKKKSVAKRLTALYVKYAVLTERITYTYSGFRGSAEVPLKSALFWDFTQRRMVLSYRRFGKIDQFHLQGSRSFFLDCLTLEAGTDRLFRNFGKLTILRCVKTQKSAGLTVCCIQLRPAAFKVN